MTENHGLNTPSLGAENWHIPLNNNFNYLDSAIEIRDIKSNLPNYQPKQGAKYFATDTEKQFIGTGYSWAPIQTSGKSPSFDAVSSNKFNNIQVANSSQTIQEAHDALPEQGGRIYVSVDEYTEENNLPIVFSKPTILEGPGWGDPFASAGVLDWSSNTSDTIFRVDNGADQVRFSSGIRNLHVRGGNRIIDIGHGGHFDVTKCFFEDADTNIIRFLSEGGGLFFNFEHCRFENAGGTGVDMTPPPDGLLPNMGVFRCTTVDRSGGIGVHAKGVNVLFEQSAFQRSDEEGIRSGDNANVTNVGIQNCYFEGNGGSGSTDADIRLLDAGSNCSAVLNTYHSAAGSSAGRAVYMHDGYRHMASMIRGPNANVEISQYTSDCQVGWVDPRGSVTVASGATRPRVNGLGVASGNAEEPKASNWFIGETVEWTDTGDGSGDGLYLLQHNGTWRRMA